MERGAREPVTEGYATSSNPRTFANILKSYVGAGILALPYAFRKGGLWIGLGGYLLVSALALHCILLLLKCKLHLVAQERKQQRKNAHYKKNKNNNNNNNENNNNNNFNNYGNDGLEGLSIVATEERMREEEEEANSDDDEEEEEAKEAKKEKEEEREKETQNDNIILEKEKAKEKEKEKAKEKEKIKQRKQQKLLGNKRRNESSDEEEQRNLPFIFNKNNNGVDTPLLGPTSIETFTDVGRAGYGKWGAISVDVMLLSSQMGFCCVYLIFLGENLHSLISELSKILWILVCLPLVVLLCWVRTLKYVAPFSLIAVFINLSGFAVVTVYSFLEGEFPNDNVSNFPQFLDFFIFLSLAIYGYEGIGLVLPLENAAQDKKNFVRLFILGFALVTLLYMSFGVLCYLCFGNDVDAVVVLNLPEDNPVVIACKVGFISAALMTYPLFMFPVIERLEPLLIPATASWRETRRNVFRVILVGITAGLAIAIPEFDLFTSLIGSVCSTTLAFIIPALLHLKIFPQERLWVKAKDVTLILWGVAASILCTTVTIYQLIDRFSEKYG